MKRFALTGFSIFFIILALTDCKKKNEVLPQNTTVDSAGSNTNGDAVYYNKSDTTVYLQDGLITISIPKGAMKKGTKISIGTSNIAFIDPTHLLHQFELKPAGLTFKKPVTLTFHYDSAWLQGNSPWNLGIAYKNDEDGKWYPAVNGDLNSLNHTLSIKTTHFSHWSIYTCFHLYMKAGGQLSEDYSQMIRMQPGDIGLLLLTMDEPPAWKNDPDKSKEFGNPLIAPLTAPPIDPKEPYSRSLVPDEWDVNTIVNGDDHVGKIIPVSGAKEKLYQYLAPPQVPQNNEVAISALIKTRNHGWIRLIQGVDFLGKWRLSITDSVVITASGGEVVYNYYYGADFHINDKNKIIYDKESHTPLTFYKLIAPGVTSWNITSANYASINNITGTYDSKMNQLDCKLSIGFEAGATTITLCSSDGCATRTNDGSEYSLATAGKAQLVLKKEPGYTFNRDTTITYEGGEAHIYETFRLENKNK